MKYSACWSQIQLMRNPILKWKTWLAYRLQPVKDENTGPLVHITSQSSCPALSPLTLYWSFHHLISSSSLPLMRIFLNFISALLTVSSILNFSLDFLLIIPGHNSTRMYLITTFKSDHPLPNLFIHTSSSSHFCSISLFFQTYSFTLKPLQSAHIHKTLFPIAY